VIGDLDGEIGDFGGLVGLLLALATLLTANRATALADLKTSANAFREDASREVLLDLSLALVTALVVLAGVPLWLRAVHHLHPRAEGGPLRGVFALTWILLLGLVAWQLSLVQGARQLKGKLSPRPAAPPTAQE
jgi:hypothetical protein